MATNVSYPGVYIQEVPSGVRTIAGVPTSVAAFVGYTARGPVNSPVQIFSFADFERQFGGLDRDSDLSYAVSQFFLNGGGTAWIVRVAAGAAKASITIQDDAVNDVLTASAISEGAWGNGLRLTVDYDTTDPATRFNLAVSEVQDQNGQLQVVRSEIHRNLSMDPASDKFAVAVVNAASNLIRLSNPAPMPTGLPAQTGTAWTKPVAAVTFPLTAVKGETKIKLAGTPGTPAALVIWDAPAAPPKTLEELRAALEAALHTVTGPEFAGARVVLLDDRLITIPGGDDPTARILFTTGPTEGTTDLSASEFENVAAYQLGTTSSVAAQVGGTVGAGGTAPLATDLEGSLLAKSGLYALEDVDLFNILLIPNQSDATLQAKAIAYAEKRRAFALLDLPDTVDTLPEATVWLTTNGGLRHKNAAAYFPRLQFADPLQNNRVRSFANSGAIAGLYARTDAERGVWKAPAGTDAGLRGVRGVDYALTDAENGVINPLGLNAIRLSPAFGPIAWGARTLVGSDMLASEWKYIPVRRLALFLEESLYRGTQWVVFEPNDEPLWAQIRLNVGAFMHTLFRQGAFQGMTPKDAYLVQCDSTTTTQDDINLGIVNIIVGFAPLKPAEFVIIKLQQLAGQDGA
jgi:phage tail sheath protein FI